MEGEGQVCLDFAVWELLKGGRMALHRASYPCCIA